MSVIAVIGQTNYFEKEPYMFFKNKIDQSTGQVTPELDKIVIQWQLTTYPNDPCRLQYDLEQYSGLIITANYNWNDDLWYVELDLDDDLDPGELYYFQAFVMDDDIPIDGREGSFITPPLTEATTSVFYGYGDTRGSSTLPPANHDPVCEAIMNEVDNDPGSQTFLIHTGDWNYNDDEAKWTQDYFNLTHVNSLELKAKLAIMGAKGNHEITGTNYAKYWPFSYQGTATGFCYSFDYGPAHFCMIDLDHEDATLNQEKRNWIENDLSNTLKKWKIVVFHSPIFSSGGHDNNLNEQVYLQSLFVNSGVQIVLNGHNHYYAHWMVQGIHHLTLGGGGANLYSPQTDAGELAVAAIYHFAKFSLEEDMIKVNVIDKDGLHFEDFNVPQTLKICNNQHVTWDQNITYADEIRVCSGSTLTITSEVGFVENGKVIVEQGGKLELDGGLLTSVKEDEFWYGIEVWGDPSSNQNPVDQGWVKIQNGGTIINSRQGVVASLLEEDPTDGDLTPNPAYAGGIIQASDAHFINNQTAIQFYDYPHTSVSYFNNCEFKLDWNYFGTVEPENYMVIDNMT
ncbi:MAG: metallophosphoesterase family protein, partial [Bacteroidales bacterium]